MDGTTDWGPLEAIRFGWSRLRADPLGIFLPSFSGALVVSVLPAFGVLHQLEAQQSGDPAAIARAGVIRLGLSLANLPVQSFVLGGLFHFLLKVARGQRYGFADLLSGSRWFVPMLGTNVAIFVAVTAGLLLVVVPGVIALCALCMAPLLVVDRDLGAIDALKESLLLTEGRRLRLFLFGLLATALVAVGYLALFVGSYVAGVVALVGFVWVYLRLAGQTVADG